VPSEFESFCAKNGVHHATHGSDIIGKAVVKPNNLSESSRKPHLRVILRQTKAYTTVKLQFERSMWKITFLNENKLLVILGNYRQGIIEVQNTARMRFSDLHFFLIAI
jgi:hypothetical protein